MNAGAVRAWSLRVPITAAALERIRLEHGGVPPRGYVVDLPLSLPDEGARKALQRYFKFAVAAIEQRCARSHVAPSRSLSLVRAVLTTEQLAWSLTASRAMRDFLESVGLEALRLKVGSGCLHALP